MKKIFLPVLLAAVLAAAGVVSGCNKSESPAKPASAASSSYVDNPDLPPECNAYIKKIDACIGRAGEAVSLVANGKQMIENMVSQWSHVADKKQLAQICTQVSTNLDQTLSAYGCK